MQPTKPVSQHAPDDASDHQAGHLQNVVKHHARVAEDVVRHHVFGALHGGGIGKPRGLQQLLLRCGNLWRQQIFQTPNPHQRKEQQIKDVYKIAQRGHGGGQQDISILEDHSHGVGLVISVQP